jgi:hypothetical protein
MLNIQTYLDLSFAVEFDVLWALLSQAKRVKVLAVWLWSVSANEAAAVQAVCNTRAELDCQLVQLAKSMQKPAGTPLARTVSSAKLE